MWVNDYPHKPPSDGEGPILGRQDPIEDGYPPPPPGVGLPPPGGGGGGGEEGGGRWEWGGGNPLGIVVEGRMGGGA